MSNAKNPLSAFFGHFQQKTRKTPNFSIWLGPPDGLNGIIVAMTFDRTNNLLIAGTIKLNSEDATAWVQLSLIDANYLDTLARFNLPKETGIGMNFRPAGAYIGPDGTLYFGVIGGIVAVRDGE